MIFYQRFQIIVTEFRRVVFLLQKAQSAKTNKNKSEEFL